MSVVPQRNERVELAMRLLDCRQKLRRTGWDVERAKSLREEMDRLEQKLSEIDKVPSVGGLCPRADRE